MPRSPKSTAGTPPKERNRRGSEAGAGALALPAPHASSGAASEPSGGGPVSSVEDRAIVAPDYDERLRALKGLVGLPSLVDDVRRALTSLPARVLGDWFLAEGEAARAVMLCCLDVPRRAALVGLLPPSAKVEVVRVVARLADTQEGALRALLEEAHARADRAGMGASGGTTVGGREKLRALLQGLPASQAEALLDRVSLQDPALASDLRGSLLTVPRLAELFPADRARLLGSLDEKTLALFLYGVRAFHGEDALGAFLGSISRARRERMEEDLACLGPVAKAALEDVLASVVARARAEKAAGRLAFPWEDAWVS